MTVTTPLLQTIKEFCENGERNSRWHVHEPCVIGEYTYATDTKICVRAPGKLIDTTLPKGARFPPCDDKGVCDWGKAFPLRNTHQITDRKSLNDVKRCEGCDGQGYWTCDCPDCHKAHDCNKCEGRGEIHKIDHYVIQGKRFDPKYVKKILEVFPGAKVFVHKDKLLFESGVIQGLLMAMAD